MPHSHTALGPASKSHVGAAGLAAQFFMNTHTVYSCPRVRLGPGGAIWASGPLYAGLKAALGIVLHRGRSCFTPKWEKTTTGY